jgi:phosphatidylglycerophosphate synthase
VAAILILLTPHLSGFAVLAVVVILLRELLVSGLREFLATNNIAMPVTKLAKYKTAVQMAAIAALLYQIGSFSVILLWIAAILTAITGAQYTKYSIEKLKNEGI